MLILGSISASTRITDPAFLVALAKFPEDKQVLILGTGSATCRITDPAFLVALAKFPEDKQVLILGTDSAAKRITDPAFLVLLKTFSDDEQRRVLTHSRMTSCIEEVSGFLLEMNEHNRFKMLGNTHALSEMRSPVFQRIMDSVPPTVRAVLLAYPVPMVDLISSIGPLVMELFPENQWGFIFEDYNRLQVIPVAVQFLRKVKQTDRLVVLYHHDFFTKLDESDMCTELQRLQDDGATMAIVTRANALKQHSTGFSCFNRTFVACVLTLMHADSVLDITALEMHANKSQCKDCGNWVEHLVAHLGVCTSLAANHVRDDNLDCCRQIFPVRR